MFWNEPKREAIQGAQVVAMLPIINIAGKECCQKAT